jgi:septal ring factor EnvC (AmiA/AmiB activator)
MDNIPELAIGLVLGILIGLVLLRVLDRRHQKVVKKLVESRRKIERQRTQAVNDLFALRAEIEEGTYQPPPDPVPATGGEPDPRLVAELANLRSLIARADGALTQARRKRDENEAEIKRLRTIIEERTGENVINLRPQDRPEGSRTNLAL